jgi:hypothetical protein
MFNALKSSHSRHEERTCLRAVRRAFHVEHLPHPSYSSYPSHSLGPKSETLIHRDFSFQSISKGFKEIQSVSKAFAKLYFFSGSSMEHRGGRTARCRSGGRREDLCASASLWQNPEKSGGSDRFPTAANQIFCFNSQKFVQFVSKIRG